VVSSGPAAGLAELATPCQLRATASRASGIRISLILIPITDCIVHSYVLVQLLFQGRAAGNTKDNRWYVKQNN
jgi:hypothetical protein